MRRAPIGAARSNPSSTGCRISSDLGVSAILLTASGEFPTDVSLGYNPAHIFAIESSYGGPNGFRAFVDAANQRGIAVILDVVYNHFGPSDLDLWNFDGWHAEGGDGGIYFYNQEWRRRTPWGPRPDYGRAEVRRYIRDNAVRWIDSRGADGLRWDMTAYIRNLDGRNNDPAGDIADGWTPCRTQRRDRAPRAERRAHGRGHAGQRMDHQAGRHRRRRLQHAVVREVRPHPAPRRHHAE